MPPKWQPRRGMPSDPQRATFERASAGLRAGAIVLGWAHHRDGTVTIRERRAPKRVVAKLDVLGRRIRWNEEHRRWELHPWRHDP